MKTFSTSGTGNQQTLSEIESDKMPIYDSVADAEADLANLEEGQIVATKDTGTELSQPVDVVESGNLHAVTSNAVAQVTNNCRIKTVSMDGNTNAVGTFDVRNIPNIKEILCFKCTNNNDYMYTVGFHNTNGFWIKILNYDFTPIANAYITGEMTYLEQLSN